MNKNIDHGPVFCVREISLKEAEEYFGKPYKFIESKDNKKEMYDCFGNLIGWSTISHMDKE